MVNYTKATAHRIRWEKECPDWSVFDVCHMCHMAVMGSADPLPPDRLDLFLSMLCDRNESWIPSDSDYDNSAHCLVKATIVEINAYLNERI